MNASFPGIESSWKLVDRVKQLWKTTQELKVEDVSIAVSSGVVCLVLCWRDIRKRFTFTCYMSDKLIVPPKASTSSSSNPYEVIVLINEF